MSARRQGEGGFGLVTYTQTGDDALDLTFEIAPPGQPEAFAPYIQARARRVTM